MREEDSEHVTSPIIVGFGGYYECGKDAAADHLVKEHEFEKQFFSEPLHEWLLVQNPWIKLDIPLYGPGPTYGGPEHDYDNPDLVITHEAGSFIRYVDLIERVGYVNAKEQREVRRLLQATGTDAGRRLIHEDVWANRMEVLLRKRLAEMERSERVAVDGSRRPVPQRIAITGVRYPNELRAIRNLGGVAVWVERPSARKAHLKRLEEDSERVAQGLEPLVHESDLMLLAGDFDQSIPNTGTLADLYARTDEWVKAQLDR